MDDAPAIPEIDVDAALARLAAGGTLFVDVRDPGSYRAARVPGARHLGDDTIRRFVEETERSQPIVIYCYHGHMSQGGAAYLIDKGFTHVASLSGGFEAWRGRHPHESG